MKTIIKTIADYICNMINVAWYELPVKRAKKTAKMIFKSFGGALWEVTANVKNGVVVGIAIQGLLF